MPEKPTYEELTQRLAELERAALERARAEEDLRESEELHRVVLTNLSDTVLITDDAGAFKFVCPNVNVIFGYSFDEVLALKTVDRLLGMKLAGPENFRDIDEIENVECVISDKNSQSHTLLINIKRVSVNGGTLLYACRDITDRKRPRTLSRKPTTNWKRGSGSGLTI